MSQAILTGSAANARYERSNRKSGAGCEVQMLFFLPYLFIQNVQRKLVPAKLWAVFVGLTASMLPMATCSVS